MGFGLMRERRGTAHGFTSRGAPEGCGAQRWRPVEWWRWRKRPKEEDDVGVGWAGVAGWAECHLGRRGEKTKKNRDGPQGRLGQNGFGLR
jgi:hypothetical protein